MKPGTPTYMLSSVLNSPGWMRVDRIAFVFKELTVL